MGLTPEQAAKLKADLEAAWDKSSPWKIKGSIDLKDKGVEIDFEHNEPAPEYTDDG
jgi:hypothetical protein